MAKTLTLEEAAQKLGQTPEQFKTNLKTHKDFRSVRPLMGGATMHFRAQDIDELARRLGLGSDPELQMGDAGAGAAATGEEQIEIGRPPGGSAVRSGSKRQPAADIPLVTDSSEDFVPISGDQAKKADSAARLAKGDSDVKVEKRSGIRPADSSKQHARSSEVFGVADDPKSGSKHKASAKKPIDNSEFELKLGADSSSEFELTVSKDEGDEVDLGSMPRDVSGKKGGSGVKLNNPADSGISLEKDSDSEFELNLDSTSSAKLGGPRSSSKRKKAQPDSDSEFELTLDDSSSEIAPLDSSGPQSDKDIFETDFDIPALDDESGSEAVALDENDTDLESSDFDLAVEEGESASEVVEVDESGVEAVEDESAAEALAEVDEEAEPSRVVTAAPAKWGPLPAIVLGLCFPVMLIVTLMSYELVHGMWGFHQPSNRPTSAVTRGIASIFNNDSELPKEP